MIDIGHDGSGDSRSSLDATLNGVAADFNAWRAKTGLGRRVYASGGKKRIHTVSVSDDAYAGLRYLAKAHATYFGTEVSVSALLEAIGTFQLYVSDATKHVSSDTLADDVDPTP